MRLALCLLVCLAAWAPVTRAEDPPADATHLHALLIADTNDETIGASVRQDVGKMELALSWGVPEERYSATVLEGDAVTPDGIRGAIQAIDVKPTDTLLVFYAGHGAWSEGGHYLRMNDGKVLERKDLRAAIEAKAPRLGVLVTDCCSTYVGKHAFAKQLINDPDLFRDLFFRHRGVIDVTAAEKGQVAVGDEIQGGYFTSALVDALTTVPRESLDRDKDRIVTWAELLPAVKVETEATFRHFQPRGLQLGAETYAVQRPHVFADDARPVAGPIPASTLRLGVEVRNVEGGVEVAKVHPGTPAAWAGFRPGERITWAMLPGDGSGEDYREIKTVEDLGMALAAVVGPQVIGLATEMPGEKDAQGNAKKRDRRVHLSH